MNVLTLNFQYYQLRLYELRLKIALLGLEHACVTPNISMPCLSLVESELTETILYGATCTLYSQIIFHYLTWEGKVTRPMHVYPNLIKVI